MKMVNSGEKLNFKWNYDSLFLLKFHAKEYVSILKIEGNGIK